jgi:hypothetical protein
MRNANAQQVRTMIFIGVMQQARKPHVSHAETAGCVLAG